MVKDNPKIFITFIIPKGCYDHGIMPLEKKFEIMEQASCFDSFLFQRAKTFKLSLLISY